MRTRVAVIGGGRSCEHDVSLASAASVATGLDPAAYDVVRLTIGRDGTWRDRGGRPMSLAGAAQEIFAEDPQVEVLAADWSTLRDKGPFSLLFLDSGARDDVRVEGIADLVEPGGIVVLDDFVPCAGWPPVSDGRVDTLREEWLTDERFTAVEVMVADDATAIIATRR